MIVDDDVAARDLLSSLVRTLFNVTVDTVADGVDAMRKCREQRYDIIWMDFEMPGVNGLGAIEVIRSIVPDQFIVMVSGHSDVEIVKKAISLGVGGYLVKPLTSGKVKSIVDKYMQSKSG
jgi:YesN/AraC family two-component response regulator